MFSVPHLELQWLYLYRKQVIDFQAKDRSIYKEQNKP